MPQRGGVFFFADRGPSPRKGTRPTRYDAQILQDANLSLDNGLGPLADRAFRIGHLGDFSDASVLGTLAAIEMGLKAQGVPFGDGAIEAAIEVLSDRRLVMAEAAE